MPPKPTREIHVFGNDLGQILFLVQEFADATDAFYGALSLTPDFADPYVHLATLAMQQSQPHEAARLMRSAVECDRTNSTYLDRLANYEAIAAVKISDSSGIPDGDGDLYRNPPAGRPVGLGCEDDTLSSCVSDFDWTDLSEQLTADGIARLPRLLNCHQVETIREMFREERRFAKTVTMDKPRFGKGVYKYFNSPVPQPVESIRQVLFPYVAEIANHWQERLQKTDRFPTQWPDFRRVCHRAGQTAPTPLLLRYDVGGFNAPHRDLRGEVFFPIQLAIVLSPHREYDNSADGFLGGDFVLCGSKEDASQGRTVELGVGDGVLFCTRDRLESCGSSLGLVPVRHGSLPVTVGERYVLAIPFHEYLP